MNRPFCLQLRVYYEDTDVGGVVYYANYLKYMERARSEWLRAQGLSNTELAREHGVLFAVRSVELDYHKPARLDDWLSVSAEVVLGGAASLVFRQDVRRGDELLCGGHIKLACLDTASFSPRPLPASVAGLVPSK